MGSDQTPPAPPQMKAPGERAVVVWPGQWSTAFRQQECGMSGAEGRKQGKECQLCPCLSKGADSPFTKPPPPLPLLPPALTHLPSSSPMTRSGASGYKGGSSLQSEIRTTPLLKLT